jgi:hypothetical protein
MNMLVDTLHQVGESPYSWAIVGLIAAATLFSLFKFRTCPYLHHTKAIPPEESAASLDRPFAAGPRFVLVMLAGIAAILTGLTMLSHEINPPLALLFIVFGVFAVQIEPALLQIQEAVKRVTAAHAQGPEAITAAEDRLRNAHVWLVMTSFTILIAVVLALLAF